MTKATGNTYSVKDDLKSVGFKWLAESKEWYAPCGFDKDRWENKCCNPSYNGRKQARLCSEVRFVEE